MGAGRARSEKQKNELLSPSFSSSSLFQVAVRAIIVEFLPFYIGVCVVCRRHGRLLLLIPSILLLRLLRLLLLLLPRVHVGSIVMPCYLKMKNTKKRIARIDKEEEGGDRAR